MGFIFRSEADLLGPQRRETTWIETPRHDQVIFDTFPQIQIISRGLFEYMEKLKKKFKENKNDFFVSETTYSILIRRPDRPFLWRSSFFNIQ